MDFSLPEDLSSPEIRRGGSFYSEQLISNLGSLHLECKNYLNVYFRKDSPDVKNSTILPAPGARNLGDISEIQCSPIEHVYIQPTFNISTETTSSTPDMTDGQSTNFLGHQNVSVGSQNAVVLNVICEEEEKCAHSFSQENALPDNQLLKQKEQMSSKSEGCVTPSQVNQARKFKRAHHSQLNSPPTHWTRTPVAVCDCDKPIAGAATHSIVPTSLTPLLTSAKDDNIPQLLTPRCDLNRLTTLEVPMSSSNRKTPECSADVVARSISKGGQQHHIPKKSILDPRAQEVREWIAKVIGEEREQN
ncbi:hypothetical protein EG68_05325 [Paragonimus skrjabini miyazakii]|uniref:Uncharacterized protein n=1 Tax=Paragonimus skrjabini miyazakii TaxID=59628 RepID=A0A8S9Y8V8_9TREM|nr:hypothetical protein EG68_05325 [Paragonimus skrjabini miyazakii]